MAENAIFISYRRDDSRDPAGRIHDRLVEEFGKDAMFFDIETMPYGEDFRRHVVKVLGECRACLVVIGPRWATLTDDKGARRLDDADDLVRIEVETALKRKDAGLSVIPVLVSDARMPDESELPAAIAELSVLNAAAISSGRHFHHDVGSLINRLRKVAGLEKAGAAEPATPAGRAWAKIGASTDIEDLQRFAEAFPGTEEGLEARRRIDRLKKENADYAAMNWQSLASIDAFVAAWPQSHRAGEIAVKRTQLQQKLKADEEARAAKLKAEEDARVALAFQKTQEKAAREAAKAAGRQGGTVQTAATGERGEFVQTALAIGGMFLSFGLFYVAVVYVIGPVYTFVMRTLGWQ